MTHASRRLQLETQAANLLRSMLLGVTDDPEVLHDTIEGSTSLEESIHGVLKDIGEDEMLLAGIQAAIIKLQERKDRIEFRIETRKDAIQTALEAGEITKPLVYPEGTISLRRTAPNLIIEDATKIPAQFWKPQEPVLSKSDLKNALKSGNTIEGCSLSNGSMSLSIRRS